MNYYTYAYLREDKTPYYIGKGKGSRIYNKRKNDIKPPKDKIRIIFLKQNLTEEEAFKHEIYMISVFGRKDLGTGILHNRTNGGEGISGYKHSQETKDTLSSINKGKVHSKKTKGKISIGNKGKKQTEDTKRKIGDANRLYEKDSEEFKESVRKQNKKYRDNMSEESKNKSKQYHKQYYLKNKDKWKKY
jgi:hypothetical protein